MLCVRVCVERGCVWSEGVRVCEGMLCEGV